MSNGRTSSEVSLLVAVFERSAGGLMVCKRLRKHKSLKSSSDPIELVTNFGDLGVEAED
jgi:hypothetical protein